MFKKMNLKKMNLNLIISFSLTARAQTTSETTTTAQPTQTSTDTTTGKTTPAIGKYRPFELERMDFHVKNIRD